MEQITISKKEYDRLMENSDKFECLEAVGVDNWCGWDDAMAMHREEPEE